ncbi:MAG: TrkH family potassium uptake protein, partial [Clostridia bacterium]|nr:TrkH family potassium uptake protein [Clostridia bacterium]
MNYKMTVYILGQIALIMAVFMLIPFIIALAGVETLTPLAFGVTIGFLALFGAICMTFKPKDTTFNVRGGFLIVALAWISFSVFGSLPYYISGAIPNFIDCLFESVSGFSTTGATILLNVETLSPSLLFWRSFTHWIGGMGVLLFVIAILPKNDPSVVHMLKAETPGPKFGKIVSKMNFTARILYFIYVVLTLVQVVLLLFGGMNVFDAFIHAFGTAGTGGFSNYNASIGYFDSLYIEVVVTVFMLIFSINFNLFFLILIGHAKEA